MAALEDPPQALNLNWVYGSTTEVKNNVVNLSDGYSERICYLAAHTAVIYDKRTRRHIFLQGHCNSINCITVTEDRSTIITADVGYESLLVLWHSKTGQPVKTVPKPHKHGICALDISPDGLWLATVSAADPATGEQEVALWSMAALSQDPMPRPSVLTAIPTGDAQLAIRFNVNNFSELITNGKRRVYFWSSSFPQSGRFKYYSPPLRSKDFKQSVGDFTMSVFVPGSTQALTATADGDLVVWDEQGITAQMGTRATDRRAVKLMRVHNTSITYLSTIGDYIVTGGKDGFVRFFDPLLRITAWFEDLNCGPITGVSFSAVLPDRLAGGAELADTLGRFLVPDFVVATSESRILAVAAQSFEEFDVEKRKGVLVLENMLTDAVDVVAHPVRAEFAVLGKSGRLQRWDMVTHTCITSRSFNKMVGVTVSYSRDGAFMVVGFEGGYLNIINTDDLGDLHVARNTPATITKLTCSTTGTHVAAADEHHHVLLYAFLPYKHTSRWEFVGKSQTHHASIVALTFGESPSGQTRLFSVGAEGRVVEYDLDKSSLAAGLKTVYYQDFPPSSTPCAMSFAPPLQYFKHHSAETLLLIAGDDYKIRLYNPDQQACVATYLGPTFGGSLTQLVMFKSARSDGCFLAYATAERVVGLVAWPMDGDPARAMGLIAHPGGIKSVSITYDGRKLVTVGAEGCVNQWDITTEALERAVATSLKRQDRWARILDNPELLDEIRDYFYYAQIKAQGEDSIGSRAITGKVPTDMVPDLMRAAGFYPSNADIANLMHHIDFIAHGRDMETMPAVAFEDFLSLYINHRPLFDVTQEDIAAAFKALGANPSSGKLTREQLLTLLHSVGEPMSKQELITTIQSLTGAEAVSSVIPSQVEPGQFASDVLGFEAAGTVDGAAGPQAAAA